MKRTKYTKTPIAGFLKQQKVGKWTGEIIRCKTDLRSVLKTY